MTKSIPINRAKDFAKLTDLEQVIIFGWDGEKTHVVTWGKDEEACQQAAAGANKIKTQWNWPNEAIVESESVLQLKKRIKELEGKLLKKESPSHCYLIKGTEYERGWGQRPDGFVAFTSKPDAEAYIVAYDKKYNNQSSVPDEYTKYAYFGLHECSQAFYESLLAVGKLHIDKLVELQA